MKLPSPIVAVVLIGLVISLAVEPKSMVSKSFLDKEIEIDSEAYIALKSILSSGTFSKDDLEIDFGGVQTMTMDGGLVFDPPARVSWKFLKTTVTKIKAGINDNSIFIDVDSSPIDVNVVPKS